MAQPNHRKSAFIGGTIALSSVATMVFVYTFGSISLLVLVIGICCAVILGLVIYTALAVSKDKPAVTDTLELLFELSKKNNVSFEELCVYALTEEAGKTIYNQVPEEHDEEAPIPV